MIFDPQGLSGDAFYHLMNQAVVPRPIAWVLSLNPNGTFNVAPFSYFSGVATEPPIIMISVGWKDVAARKDTWVNIEERNDFVVHIPPVEMAQAVALTSKMLPFNVSELELAGLHTVSVEGFSLPRLEGPKVAFFCRKHKIVEVGVERQGLILGEILRLWVDDGVVSKSGERNIIEIEKMNPLSRLGGNDFGRSLKLSPVK